MKQNALIFAIKLVYYITSINNWQYVTTKCAINSLHIKVENRKLLYDKNTFNISFLGQFKRLDTFQYRITNSKLSINIIYVLYHNIKHRF